MELRSVIYALTTIYYAYGQVNPTQSDCECVPYYQCENNSIITNGKGMIDIRIKPVDCPSYLEICCFKEEILLEPITRSPSVDKRPGCGYLNSDGTGYRITGNSNNEAQFGEFPWMIAVLRKDESDKYSFECGGSLIHPQVVLTGAHCISEGGTFKVRAGEWDTQTTNEIYKHQDKQVTSTIIHEKFNRENLHNDVALLFLESPVELDEHIGLACLPPKNAVAASKDCYVTGWGKDRFEKQGQYQVILKKINVPVVPRRQCQRAFRKTRLGQYFELHKSFMCAGGEEGKDACTGDGGGPLVCPIAGQEDRYEQVGMVAWGIGCGTRGVPGAYVDVARFRSWIDQKLQERSFDTDGYQYDDF